MLLVIILCTFVAVLLTRLYQKFGRLYVLSRQFSGPPSLPIIGHGYHFFNIPSNKVPQVLYDIYLKYGTHRHTLKLWMGLHLLLFVNDIQDIEQVLSGHNEKFNNKGYDYRFLRPWLNDGLLLSKEDKWHKRRKIITPAFHFNILESFVECFDRHSKILVKNLSQLSPDEEVEFLEPISRCTLDIIGESGMGVKLNSQNLENSEYFTAVKMLTRLVAERITRVLYRYDFIYKFTKLGKLQKDALSIVHSFTENIILTRREELLKQEQENPKKTFLDILLQSQIDGKPLSNLEIKEEVETFLFEGHDTTASALTFFFYNMGKHSKEQQKCYEEIISTFGVDDSVMITYDKLMILQYTEMCIKETLRFFPPVPVFSRKINEECELNGRIFPAGADIVVSLHYLARRKGNYPEPSKFKPERFSAANSSEKMHPFSYIPFSAGPRNCIGQKYAMLELKTVIVNVLKNFEIKYCGDCNEDEPLLAPHVVLRTVDPLMFKFKKRSNMG